MPTTNPSGKPAAMGTAGTLGLVKRSILALAALCVVDCHILYASLTVIEFQAESHNYNSGIIYGA